MTANLHKPQNSKAQVNRLQTAARAAELDEGARQTQKPNDQPATKPNGGGEQPPSKRLDGMPPLDQSLTDQFLTAAGCINPSSEDIVGANTAIFSALTHIVRFLNNNPAALDDDLEWVSTGFSDVMKLIRCADSLGWQDDTDSILPCSHIQYGRAGGE